jgi:hypothetical protein
MRKSTIGIDPPERVGPPRRSNLRSLENDRLGIEARHILIPELALLDPISRFTIVRLGLTRNE